MFGRKYQRDKRKKLLHEIYQLGGTLTIIFTTPGRAPFALQKYMKNNNVSNSELKRSIKAMTEDGLISMKEKDGQITVRLLKNGKEKALKYQIDTMKIKKPKKWDKKWRIVMFDIPERKKLARDILKHKLDELGFQPIQKSVYAYPFSCEDEIDFISAVYEIRPYVKIIRADKIFNEEKLLRHFDL